jgi:hypothetical protein
MRNILRVAAVVAAVALPLGLSTGQASAKPKPKPKATPQISVTCSPNPLVETATSNVLAICQVESNPSNAGTPVTISSTQLASRCATTLYHTIISGGIPRAITLPLDNDGNALVAITATDCAPGSALVTADLDGPPFSTAVTKLVIEPPQVTAPGVKGFPANEVEVGDNTFAVGTSANTASEVEIVFYIETNPVYAEQSASITSDQLTERCLQGFIWQSSDGTSGGGSTGFHLATFGTAGAVLVPDTGIDNDGNVAVLFQGASCAAGKSTVIAEIGGGGPTYSTQFNILPPAVTI